MMPSIPFKRRPIVAATTELVRMAPLAADHAIPLCITPAVPGVDLIEWAVGARTQIDELLLKHKALLFRGFQSGSAGHFEEFARVTADGDPLEYVDRTTPRTKLTGRLYTSTIYPRDRKINLHNEGTYWTRWPLKIFFGCLKAPETGGETPLANVAGVLRRISAGAQQKFRETGFLLERNYNQGFGLTWQEVFQTEDRAEVERYCRANRIDVEWTADDQLRTRQVRGAIRTHPKTGEEVWFNHAIFFHWSSYPPAILAELERELGYDQLPYRTFYGDGSEIPAEIAAEVRAAYDAEEVAFPWLVGDILMLDNMTVAHGRAPYTGERLVAVSMYEAWGGQQV